VKKLEEVTLLKKYFAMFLVFLVLCPLVPAIYAWQIERPMRGEPLDIYPSLRRVDNVNSDYYASTGLGVGIDQYIEDFDDPPYVGSDFINMNVTMNANSRTYIQYDSQWLEDFMWFDETDLNDYYEVPHHADDFGCWVDFPEIVGYPITFRFFGGPGSAEYTSAWISSNGFISFDGSESNPPYPSIHGVPSSQSPNAMIAALWTDLIVDSDSKIVTGSYSLYPHSYFVILWKNVKDKGSNERLTFEIILEDAPGVTDQYRCYGQSNIWISYQTTPAIDDYYAVGIEDLEGYAGTNPGSHLYSGPQLQNFQGKTLKFSHYGSRYFLRRITLAFRDSNPHSRIMIKEGTDGVWIGGYNLVADLGQSGESAPVGLLFIGLGSAAILTGLGGVVIAGIPVGLTLDCFLLTLDVVDLWESAQVSARSLDVYDDDDGITARANATGYVVDYAVDASLSLIVHWVMDDSNNEAHSLTITATTEYYEYTTTGQEIDRSPVSTSITLDVKSDSQFDGLTLIEGTHDWLYVDCLYDFEDNYYVDADAGQIIRIEMTPSQSDDDFHLYIHDPGGTLRNSSELGPGQTEVVRVQAHVSGLWRIRVDPTDDNGFYSLKVDLNENTPPTASNLQISPSWPASIDDLFASYDYFDADNSPESGSQICWYENGAHQPEYDNLDILPSSAIAAGDLWHFTVRPKDGYAFGDIKTSPCVIIWPAHDVAITLVNVSKTIVGQGYSMKINATVTNEGDFFETFNVMIYLNISDPLPTYVYPMMLAEGDTQTLTYVWDTTGDSLGDYFLYVSAEAVVGETNTDNNLLYGEPVLVTIPGDVDGDRDVDIFDMTSIAGAYDSEVGDPNYHPNCDIDGDGDVDIFDVVIAAGNYEQSW
jgi:hypothetical protein